MGGERGLAGTAGSYVPSVPSNWHNGVPTTIQDALDELVAAAGTPGFPSFNPAWYAQPLIVVDPQNSTGLASNSNAGTSAGAPLLTFSEAVRRWGSSAPFIPSTVASLEVRFLSSHTDNSDPVFWTPSSAGPLVPFISATTPAGTAAVLGGVTAKSRAAGTNSPLIATLPAGTTVGTLVVNTTAGKASRAYAKVSLGGGSWELSQPLAPQTIPQPGAPLEVNTWANGDTVQVIHQIAVNVAYVSTVLGESNASFDNSLYLYNLQIFDPIGEGSSNFLMGSGVSIIECAVQRFLCNEFGCGLSGGNLQPSFQNMITMGGGQLTGFVGNVIGGAWETSGYSLNGCQLFIDGDFALDIAVNCGATTLALGFFYLGANLSLFGASEVNNLTGSYGGHALYGRAGAVLALNGRTRSEMSTGTWAAGWTAPTLVTGVTMNGGTTAQTHTNASPDVVTSGVTTSVANADAATGGTMQVWGGASISKGA